jgi:hypothetical protein
MTFRQFAERAVRIDDEPFSLAGRPYLDDVYATRARRIVLRAARQVEKTTFIINRILYEAWKNPAARILFVTPRREQARLFSADRLGETIRGSSVLRKLLWPCEKKLPTFDIQFVNGARVYVRSAFLTADAARGISATVLMIDEFQDLAGGSLAVLAETLSHATNPLLILTGTPKLIDNHLEASFGASTAREWHVTCPGCHQAALMDERVLGITSLLCPHCQTALDPQQGQWIARRPDSTWGEGFWINHLMVPWMNVPEIVAKQLAYNSVSFRNEVLGLPVTLGDHIITREQIEACCDKRPFARAIADVPGHARRRVFAGLDWGGGGVADTTLVIGYIDPNRVLRVLRFDRWKPYADPDLMMVEIAQRCKQLGVRIIGADGGGFGRHFNRLLLGKLHQERLEVNLYSLFYSTVCREPLRDGAIYLWTVDRTQSIADLFGRIKKGLLKFPRVEESRSFLDEFTCVVAKYDPTMRSVKFIKPETLRDDALHATNYCDLLGLRVPASAIE